MPKRGSAFKRGYSDHASSGVWIDIKTEEAYRKLKDSAHANGVTIGQWAERATRYALSGEPYIPPYRHTGPATPTKRARGFRLSDMTYAWIETKVGEDNARPWIGKTLLAMAAVELERKRGQQVEHEWAERYRI